MGTKLRTVMPTVNELRAKIAQFEVALSNMDEADEVECFVQPGPRPKPKSFCCEGHERRNL